ncbi:MAG: non-ribosomal peptide synthetase [Gammaproteobacteria bacterium]
MSYITDGFVSFKKYLRQWVSRNSYIQSEFSPLTLSQERLWFLHQLNPADLSYNLGVAFRFDGKINPEFIFVASEEIVFRHSALRTIFVEEDGKITTLIKPFRKLNPAIIDKSSIEITNINEDVHHELQKLNNIPYDLEQGPIFRYELIHYSDDLHYLLFCTHHIIYDGLSLILHFKEFAEIYDALLHGRKNTLPLQKWQYLDFAKEQKVRLTAKKQEKILAYWKNRLADVEPLELPTDVPKTLAPAAIKAKLLSFPDELTGSCVRFSEENDRTVFNILFSCFCIMLSRYSGQTDFVVGVPVNGRGQKKFQDVIGFFVNTLPLRVILHKKITFNELLMQVKKNIRDALAHQEVSLPQLAAKLNIKRYENRDPIIQVMFEFDKQKMVGLQFQKINMELAFVESDNAPYEIVFETHAYEKKIDIVLKYNANLYCEETITRMFHHWINITKSAIEDPDAPVNQLTMLMPEEYSQIIFDWNNTTRSLPEKTIDQLFEEQTTKTPNNLAISSRDQSLTYQQLNQNANQLAHYLREKGVKSDDIVAICLPRSLDLIVCLLAILKAGGAYLVLDTEHPEERLNYELNETKPTFLLTSGQFLHKFSQYEGNFFLVDQQKSELSHFATDNLSKITTLNNSSYAIYTSGSTGKPKGVLLKHCGLANLVAWYKHNFRLTEKDRASQFAAVSFDAMGCEIWPYLSTGASVYLMDEATRHDPILLIEWLKNNEITICDLPTVVAEMLLPMEWPAGMRLRILKIGGEKVSRLPAKQFFFEIWNTYGPTEATIECIATRLNNKTGESLFLNPPIGKPIDNVKVYILDSTLNPVSIGVPGELYIAGAGLAKGYINNPELTSEYFVTNLFGNEKLYRTGDICQYLPDGNIEYIKRSDDQIKLHGFRIELGEIEVVLKKHLAVKEALVLLKTQPNDKQLVAYWTAQDNNKLIEAKELKNFLRKFLPEFMIPVTIIQLENFPLTRSKKIDKNALLSKYILLPKSEIVLPRTTYEMSLAAIWCEVLKIDQVSLKDNFFELGGSSLTSMQLLANINQKFHICFSLADIFKNQTLEEQVNALQIPTEEQSVIIPFGKSASKRSLFCIHPVGGNVACYIGLANKLKNDFALYGVQFPHSEVNHRFYSIESLSDFYLTQLKRIQPQGPYALIGWSTGGLIAFELAKKLVTSGEKIRLLAMIDTYNPGDRISLKNMSNNVFLWHVLNILLPMSKKTSRLDNLMLYLLKHHCISLSLLAHFFGIGNRIDIKKSLQCLKQDLTLPGAAQFPLNEWISLLKKNQYLPSDFDSVRFAALYEELRIHFLMTESYRPSYYPGDLLLFVAKKPFFTHHWDSLCQDVTQIQLPVNHYQAISQPLSLELISKTIIHIGGK